MSALVQQCQLEGERDMRLGCIFAAAAKNRRPDRSGHSARSRVFGQEERLPGSIVDAMQDGENPEELEEALVDPVFARSLEIRQHAQAEFIRLDNSEVWRRALTSGPRPERAMWIPGAQVYFWRRQRAPHVLKGKRARFVERWHGPAVVLGREMRDPRLSSAVMSQMMHDMRSMLGDDRLNLRLYDLRQPAEDEPAQGQSVALEVVAADMAPDSAATA